MSRHGRGRLVVALAAALVTGLLGGVAVADDVLVLTNGRTVSGRIVEETDEAVALEIGGGRVWYPRSRISEVRRDGGDGGERAAAGGEETGDDGESEATVHGALLRESYGLVYDGDERRGVRELRIHRTDAGGLRLEERLVFAPGPDEAAPRVVQTVEHVDRAYRPVTWLFRDTGGDRPLRVEGSVQGEELVLDANVAGRKLARRLALDADVRFRLAAREFFLEESETLGGELRVRIPDARTLALRPVALREGPRRKVLPLDDVVEARTLTFRTGDDVLRDWVLADGSSYLLDLPEGGHRVLWATAGLATAVRDGTAGDVTGPDSAARRRYEDEARGWSIGKPDPTWLFEEPLATGGGALLVVRSEALSASVDVLRDPSPPEGVTLDRAGEALQRLCRTLAADFRVRGERVVEGVEPAFYEVEAVATRKGQRVFTLGRVVLHEGQVYRLLAACPEGWEDAVRPDLERILDSFRP